MKLYLIYGLIKFDTDVSDFLGKIETTRKCFTSFSFVFFSWSHYLFHEYEKY